MEGLSDPQVWSGLIFLSSLLLLGMPHGAVDHDLYYHPRRPSNLQLLAFCSIYLAIAGFLVALWWFLPVLSAWGLIFLTWYHWGEGDWTFEKQNGGEGNPVKFPFAVWRGALPMMVPALGNPELYVEVMEAAIRIVGHEPGGAFRWLVTQQAWWSLILGLVILFSFHGLALRRANLSSHQLRRYGLEDLFLILLFVSLPPLASIGLYFSFWHSRRHIITVARKLGGDYLNEEKKVAWLHFYKRAAPFSIGGILMIVIVYLLAQSLQWDLTSLISAYLIILWALTWPHAIICKKKLI